MESNIIKDKDQQENVVYPYLGVYNNKDDRGDLVILFTEKNTGICIHGGEKYGYSIGYTSREWEERHNFRPFKGTVELRN